MLLYIEKIGGRIGSLQFYCEGDYWNGEGRECNSYWGQFFCTCISFNKSDNDRIIGCAPQQGIIVTKKERIN